MLKQPEQVKQEVKSEQRQKAIKFIKLKQETYDRLTEIGKKKETYNDIISRLLDDYFKLVNEEQQQQT